MLPRRSPRSEKGQAAIFTILCLTSLIGAVALVVDVGIWRTERGHMVNAADAAALAGAASLNQGPGPAIAIANATAAANGAGTSTAVTLSEDGPDDLIQVRVTAPGEPYFARLFGIGEFDIEATATAKVKAYTSISKKPAVPIAITPDAIPATGDEMTLKFSGGGGTTGNYGAIELPYEENACQAGSGASTWSDLLAGTSTVCKISVGDTVGTEPGNMADPTDKGLDERIGANADSFDEVVQLDPNGGLATILKPDSPRLVAVPIVVSADDGTSTFPNGRGGVRIVGFAYFFITSWSGGEVKGRLVRALADLDEDTGGTGGTTSGIYTISLVG